jgi:hypothetical protein
LQALSLTWATPVSEYRPSVQALQTVLLTCASPASEYLPSLQGLQNDFFVTLSSLNLPAGHASHEGIVAEKYFPFAQLQRVALPVQGAARRVDVPGQAAHVLFGTCS